MRDKQRAPEIRADLQQHLQRLADILRVSLHVRVEECFAHNLQRDPHHFFVEVPLFAVLPFVQQPLGVFHHRRGVTGDARAMKRGLRQAPLAQPEISVARQQAAPKNTFVGQQHAASYEFSRMIYQNIFNVVRMIEQKDAEIQHAKADKIAVLARETREITKWITVIQRAQRPTLEPAGRTGEET